MRRKAKITHNFYVINDEYGRIGPLDLPQTVQEVLFSHQKCPDPFWDSNELAYQFIDKETWEYETDFFVDGSSGAHQELVFYGLDTFVTVHFDGLVLGFCDNMHRTWRFPLPPQIEHGMHHLRLVFASPLELGRQKLKALGFALSAINDQSERGGAGEDRVSSFIRKAGYHFGWDWGPRLVTVGPWRPIELDSWSRGRILVLQVFTRELGDRSAIIQVRLQVELDVPGLFDIKLSVSAISLVQESKHCLELKSGINELNFDLTIKDPELWWPRGEGKQNLYGLGAMLAKGDDVLDSQDTRFGIRTVELRQQADTEGVSFQFAINGRELFMRGANWIPNDNFLPRVDHEKLARMVDAAVDVSMNMLRVWGGGIFEDDRFYELCDEKGIVIWQDFLFACSMYPGDPAFLASVEAEARDNIRRLSNHPSLVLWCGNNEIDAAWRRREENAGWGWKERHSKEERAIQEKAYDDIFLDVLPRTLARENPGALYWSSSPIEHDGGHAGYEGNSGDIHYWGVWHGKEPFERFDEVIPRFMSEYGFQSFPDPWALDRFAPADQQFLESTVMLAHQRSGTGNALIKEYMAQHYAIPRNFDHFVLVSQILQAEGMRRAIEAHRRERQRCSGTLYWQLNDCWPAASWSSIDWKGRWKAAHYQVRRVYADVMLSAIRRGSLVELHVVNDSTMPLEGLVQVTLYQEGRSIGRQEQLAVTVAERSARKVLELTLADWVGTNEMATSTIVFSLLSPDQRAEPALLQFVPPKDYQGSRASLQTTWTREEDCLTVQVRADALVRHLVVWSKTMGLVRYSDNFVSLLPGESKEIRILPDGGPLPQAKDFTVSTIYDLD